MGKLSHLATYHVLGPVRFAAERMIERLIRFLPSQRAALASFDRELRAMRETAPMDPESAARYRLVGEAVQRRHAFIGRLERRGMPLALAIKVEDGVSPLILWREHLGLSRRDLTARCQLSYAAVAEIEEGRREPSADQLAALAAGLSISTADLIAPPAPQVS